jgi:hypothetical protein
MTRRRRITTGLAGLLCLLVAGARPAPAFELSHYVPALFNVRDFPLPPTGVYGSIYTLYYRTDDFRDRDGDHVDSIRIRNRTLDVELSLDLYSIAPTFVWASGWKLLGAEYGLMISAPLGGPSVQAGLAIGSFGLEAEESAFGLQDIFVQPLWLTWRLPSAELSLVYAFYAPTGRFEAGASDNRGLGFWTHQIQASGAWYFLQKATALVLAGTFEVNQNKEDVDVRPGSVFTLDYGMSQYLPVGAGLIELGLRGYSQWQVTDDEGSGVRNPDARTQVHGIGGQLGYVLPKLGLGIAAKYVYEYYAESRFRGHAVTFSAGYKF